MPSPRHSSPRPTFAHVWFTLNPCGTCGMPQLPRRSVVLFLHIFYSAFPPFFLAKCLVVTLFAEAAASPKTGPGNLRPLDIGVYKQRISPIVILTLPPPRRPSQAARAVAPLLVSRPPVPSISTSPWPELPTACPEGSKEGGSGAIPP